MIHVFIFVLSKNQHDHFHSDSIVYLNKYNKVSLKTQLDGYLMMKKRVKEAKYPIGATVHAGLIKCATST
jgi:hypothetical protein